MDTNCHGIFWSDIGLYRCGWNGELNACPTLPKTCKSCQRPVCADIIEKTEAMEFSETRIKANNSGWITLDVNPYKISAANLRKKAIVMRLTRSAPPPGGSN